MQMCYQLVMKYCSEKMDTWKQQKSRKYPILYCRVILNGLSFQWNKYILNRHLKTRAILTIIRSFIMFCIILWSINTKAYSWFLILLIYLISCTNTQIFKLIYRCLCPIDWWRKHCCWWNSSFLLCFLWSWLGSHCYDTKETASWVDGIDLW